MEQTMTMIIQLINLLAITWLITETPGIVRTIKDNFNLWKLITIWVSCMKCVGFAIAIIATHDVALAAIVSYLASQFDRHLNKKNLEL